VITFRAIKPGAFNLKALEAEIRKAQREWMTKVVKEYQGTTKNWKHQVAFTGRMSESGMRTMIEVGTDDEIYGYVDEGTGQAAGRGGKYKIEAGYYTGKSNKKALAFPSVSTPKTTPGSLKSGMGKKGKVDTVRRKVMHPGIKPRDFSKQIKKKMEPVLEADMRNAMSQGAKKSGHGI